ncbi:hypothetical protein D3C75_1352650 [compost metagenome]
MPVVPTVTLPGFFFAKADRSARFLIGLSFRTVKAPGSSIRLPSRSKLCQVKAVLRSMGIVNRLGVLMKPMV